MRIKNTWFILVFVIIILTSACSNSSAENSLPGVFSKVIQPGVQNAPPVLVEIDTDLPEFPETMMVYKILTPDVNDEYANKIAETLGFSDPLPLEGDKRLVYSYENDTYILEIDMQGFIHIYTTEEVETDESDEIPTDSECIEIAENWLKSNNLYPSDISSIKTEIASEISEEDIEEIEPEDIQIEAKAVIFKTTLNNKIMNGLGTKIVVSKNGIVSDFSRSIPETEEYELVKLISSEKALGILEDYLSSSTSIPPENNNCIANMRAFEKLVINKVDLEYYLGAGYMQPVIVFEGEGIFESGTIEEFVGLVDAVSR